MEEQKVVGNVSLLCMWDRKLYKALLSMLKVPDSRAQTPYGEHMCNLGDETGSLGLRSLLLLFFQFRPDRYPDLGATQEHVILARISLV